MQQGKYCADRIAHCLTVARSRLFAIATVVRWLLSDAIGLWRLSVIVILRRRGLVDVAGHSHHGDHPVSQSAAGYDPMGLDILYARSRRSTDHRRDRATRYCSRRTARRDFTRLENSERPTIEAMLSPEADTFDWCAQPMRCSVVRWWLLGSKELVE